VVWSPHAFHLLAFVRKPCPAIHTYAFISWRFVPALLLTSLQDLTLFQSTAFSSALHALVRGGPTVSPPMLLFVLHALVPLPTLPNHLVHVTQATRAMSAAGAALPCAPAHDYACWHCFRCFCSRYHGKGTNHPSQVSQCTSNSKVTNLTAELSKQVGGHGQPSEQAGRHVQQPRAAGQAQPAGQHAQQRPPRPGSSRPGASRQRAAQAGLK
jgi:hypothetical protein